MLFTTIILTILIGLFGGIVGGALGLAGTAVMLPLLVLANILPDYKTIIGTLLFTILPPLSILAVIEYGKRKQIHYTIGVILFIAYMVGAYFGALINVKYSDKTLIYWSAITLFLTAIGLLYVDYKL
jgi:uncharacterized membrane protein YfcA